MKFTPEVVAALAVLRAAAENDFERHRLDVLERDLTAPPAPEILDEKYQRFLGVVYHKDAHGHFTTGKGIHRDVWAYYYGEIPEGYIIHHVDENKANNAPENLCVLTPAEHRKLHNQITPLIDIVCLHCGKTFQSASPVRPNFCSATCRDAHRHAIEQETRQCVICGKDFLCNKYNTTKTCSPECTDKMRYDTHRETRQCPCCGKSFTIRKSAPQQYCSVDCANAMRFNEQRDTKTCPVCGKIFRAAKSHHRTYCSKSCASIAAWQRHKSKQ